MHKKFLGICLPILGAAVIVGAGFSAWAFTDTTVNVNLQGTVDITDKLSDFSVNLYYRYIAKYSDNHGTNEQNPVYTYAEFTSFTLELDQGVLYDTTTNNIGITGYVPGVTYTNDENPEQPVTSTMNVLLDDNIYIEVRYLGEEAHLTDAFGDGNTLSIPFALDYYARQAQGVASPYVLETYVDLTDGTKAPTEAELSGVPTTALNSWGGSSVTNLVIYQSTACSFDWIWAADTGSESGIAKPENATEYDNMVTNLSESSQFHLTFTASPTWEVPTV